MGLHLSGPDVDVYWVLYGNELGTLVCDLIRSKVFSVLISFLNMK